MDFLTCIPYMTIQLILIKDHRLFVPQNPVGRDWCAQALLYSEYLMAFSSSYGISQIKGYSYIGYELHSK